MRRRHSPTLSDNVAGPGAAALRPDFRIGDGFNWKGDENAGHHSVALRRAGALRGAAVPTPGGIAAMRRRKAGERTLTATGESTPEAMREPVFIVGMNGSGTTMLLDCLDRHPAIYGFPIETKILPARIRRRDAYGNLAADENFRRLWNDLRQIAYFRVVNDGVSPPLPKDWATRERSVGSALDGIFRHFAERQGKRRWCEKSPMYALHMDVLAETFPAAKFIHVIRDGRDCAASIHRRWGFTPSLAMWRWKNVVRRARELGRPLGDCYMEVHYEELTDNPEPQMRRICQFLDEPFVETMLSLARSRSARKTRAEVIVPNKEKWRSYFTPREVARLDRIGGRLLGDLGYETASPWSDRDPDRTSLGYWRGRDNVMRATQAVRRLRRLPATRRRLALDTLITNIRHKLAATRQ